MLEFKNVSYQYDSEDFNIIDDLSFEVARGEFVSLIGISGCGKSTIFRMTNRLLTPKSGEILVDGQSIRSGSNDVGYMPQKDLLFPWRTIEKNLHLPMELRGLSTQEKSRKTDQVLLQVGLTEYKYKYPRELSGGMRQRIAFARTLLTDANLLLLDEPFSALDFLTRISMQEWLLAQWEKQRSTVMFITHDVEEAIFLSKKIYVITETPIHRLEVIDVPIGFPRTRACLSDPEVIRLREYLLELLRKQVEL